MRLIIVFLLISQSIFSQKFYTRTGLTGFKANVPAFEPVQALNKSSSAIVTNDGDIAVQLFISAFKFKIALMQEHFNENFMESDEFPKATFKGKILDFDASKLEGSKEVTIKGTLNVKGKDKEIETTGTVTKNGNTIRLVSQFITTPRDFEIKIPSLVRKKIAREVTIDIDYELAEKK